MPLSVYRIPLQVLIVCFILSANVYNKIQKNNKYSCEIYKGGYKLRLILYSDIKDYIVEEHRLKIDLESSGFKFVEHMLKSDATKYNDDWYIYVDLPLQAHVHIIQLKEIWKIAQMHDIVINTKTATLAKMEKIFAGHKCEKCLMYITVFETTCSKKEMKKIQRKVAEKLKTSENKMISCEKTRNRVKAFHLVQHVPHASPNKHHVKIATAQAHQIVDSDTTEDMSLIFPPAPLDKTLAHDVITSACKKFQPNMFEEAGCAVCGQLVVLSSLTRLKAVKNYLHILHAPGTTRQERHKKTDNVHEFPYAIDHACASICNSCRASIRSSKIPRMALAKGLWLGPVPEVLSSLRYVEKMLVAHVCHSVCSIRIASGMRKMKAHAIAYQQPMPKIFYHLQKLTSRMLFASLLLLISNELHS